MPAPASIVEAAGERRTADDGESQHAGGAESGDDAWLVNGVASLPKL